MFLIKHPVELVYTRPLVGSSINHFSVFKMNSGKTHVCNTVSGTTYPSDSQNDSNAFYSSAKTSLAIKSIIMTYSQLLLEFGSPGPLKLTAKQGAVV